VQPFVVLSHNEIGLLGPALSSIFSCHAGEHDMRSPRYLCILIGTSRLADRFSQNLSEHTIAGHPKAMGRGD
jgi:hypothetical protein